MTFPIYQFKKFVYISMTMYSIIKQNLFRLRLSLAGKLYTHTKLAYRVPVRNLSKIMVDLKFEKELVTIALKL